VVWGRTDTLNRLEDRSWLVKCTPTALGKGLLQRTLWQIYRLSQAARDEGCDVLFVPGGSYSGNFHPVVTMSQNLLPFEKPELRRYGWTLFTLKLLLLRLTQSRSFHNADGVIFLTEYARDAVLKVTGKLRGQTRIIAHGLNPRFNKAPKMQRAIADYDEAQPYRVLYVSMIDQYKHQWHVVEAVAALRQQGLPIVLDLVGPAYPPALQRLNETIARVDADRHWVQPVAPAPSATPCCVAFWTPTCARSASSAVTRRSRTTCASATTVQSSSSTSAMCVICAAWLRPCVGWTTCFTRRR
jgi:hypothetical protein